MTLARTGLSLVMSSPIDAFHALRRGDLVLPFGPERIVASAYWYRLIWRADRRLTQLQRRFRDLVAERAEAQRQAVEDWLASDARQR